jgi:hypothetical protein
MRIPVLSLLITACMLNGCVSRYNYAHSIDVRRTGNGYCIYTADAAPGDTYVYYLVSKPLIAAPEQPSNKNKINIPAYGRCIPYYDFKPGIEYEVGFLLIEGKTGREMKYSSTLIITPDGTPQLN